jgi:hypothetical protein
MGRPAGGVEWVRFGDYVGAAASLETFGHSLATVMRQSGEAVPTHTSAGFNLAEGIFRRIIQTEGTRVLFEQKNRELADMLSHSEMRLFAEDEDWSPDFEALRHLLRQSRDAGTETVLFVSPYHAEYLLLLDTAGLWPQFEMWKRRLAELARTEGVPLWDFSGFDAYSTEPVDALPPRGASLNWFWEPAHYRQKLGDLVLANIWHDHCPTDQTRVPRYGTRLNGADATDLDVHLAAQRSARDVYKTDFPEVATRIERLFQ